MIWNQQSDTTWILGSLDSLILNDRNKSLFCLDPWITGFQHSSSYHLDPLFFLFDIMIFIISPLNAGSLDSLILFDRKKTLYCLDP